MDVNLVRFKKDGSQVSCPLPSSVTVLGRRRDCDLRIPTISVSRRHCQLNLDGDILKIRDLGSHNGTFLNGQRISKAEIHAGDYVRIGPVTFVIQIDGQPEKVSLPLTEADQFPAKKHTLTKDASDEQFAALEGPDQGRPEEGLGDLEELEDLDADSSTEMDQLESLD